MSDQVVINFSQDDNQFKSIGMLPDSVQIQIKQFNDDNEEQLQNDCCSQFVSIRHQQSSSQQQVIDCKIENYQVKGDNEYVQMQSLIEKEFDHLDQVISLGQKVITLLEQKVISAGIYDKQKEQNLNQFVLAQNKMFNFIKQTQLTDKIEQIQSQKFNIVQTNKLLYDQLQLRQQICVPQSMQQEEEQQISSQGELAQSEQQLDEQSFDQQSFDQQSQFELQQFSEQDQDQEQIKPIKRKSIKKNNKSQKIQKIENNKKKPSISYNTKAKNKFSNISSQSTTEATIETQIKLETSNQIENLKYQKIIQKQIKNNQLQTKNLNKIQQRKNITNKRPNKRLTKKHPNKKIDQQQYSIFNSIQDYFN